METRIPKGKDKKSRRKDCKDPFAAGASLVRILVCEIRDDGEDLPGAGAGGGTLREIYGIGIEKGAGNLFWFHKEVRRTPGN